MLSIKEAVRRIGLLREKAARQSDEIVVKRCSTCDGFHDLDQEHCPSCAHYESTKFMGFQDRPTWLANLWLSNVEALYKPARKWAMEDMTDVEFGRKCALILLKNKNAMRDINSNGRPDRWERGLKHSINWSQIRECFRD